MIDLVKRVPYVPMVYTEARRVGYWALPAARLALWRFLLKCALPNGTSRELLLTLGLLGRVLDNTTEPESR